VICKYFILTILKFFNISIIKVFNKNTIYKMKHWPVFIIVSKSFSPRSRWRNTVINWRKPVIIRFGWAQEKPSVTADMALQYRKRVPGCQQKGIKPLWLDPTGSITEWLETTSDWMG
jgi:hypothetical protein